MRIIKEKTLKDFIERDRYQPASGQLKAWLQEVKQSNWQNSKELKTKYRNASIISSKRVVFNIKGKDFRLIGDVEYKIKLVFIVWFGTHKEYDRIDVKRVEYEK